MEVAAQNRELQIAAESPLAPVTTARQAVASLQGIDGRFDSRMLLSRLTELDRGFRFSNSRRSRKPVKTGGTAEAFS
jgi:hypothetical protein